APAASAAEKESAPSVEELLSATLSRPIPAFQPRALSTSAPLPTRDVVAPDASKAVAAGSSKQEPAAELFIPARQPVNKEVSAAVLDTPADFDPNATMRTK